jgi:hypothetical protein
MSTLGYTSGQIEHKQRLLEKINEALLDLQADAHRVGHPLGIKPSDLAGSRNVAGDFARDIIDALESKTNNPTLGTLVRRIAAQPKPINDWIEDLQALRTALAGKQPVSEPQLRVLSDLVRLFDREFTEDLYRLYGRR